MVKIYTGIRGDRGCKVTVTGQNRMGEWSTKPLDPRNDLINHSPDGFEWGYSGSGPSQLALAICCEHLGDDNRAMEVYQQFREIMISHIHDDTWELLDDYLKYLLEYLETKVPAK